MAYMNFKNEEKESRTCIRTARECYDVVQVQVRHPHLQFKSSSLIDFVECGSKINKSWGPQTGKNGSALG